MWPILAGKTNIRANLELGNLEMVKRTLVVVALLMSASAVQAQTTIKKVPIKPTIDAAVA